jgi:mannose-6-phosphate isomerase-like protein (cupin superfamily)
MNQIKYLDIKHFNNWDKSELYMSVKSLNIMKVEKKKVLGGSIKPLISNENTSKNQEFALGIFEAGEGLYPHIHLESEEICYVTAGKGTVFAGNERRPIKIEKDYVLYIPAGMPHAVTNTGKDTLTIAFFVSPGQKHAGYIIGKDCKVVEEKILK